MRLAQGFIAVEKFGATDLVFIREVKKSAGTHIYSQSTIKALVSVRQTKAEGMIQFGSLNFRLIFSLPALAELLMIGVTKTTN